LSMKRSFNFALINTKFNNTSRWLGKTNDAHWSRFLRDIARIYDWLAPDERSFVSPLINNAHFEISKRWAFEHKDGANYDFFRNRIMFPIHNEKEIS
jgi:hypothetical protein